MLKVMQLPELVESMRIDKDYKSIINNQKDLFYKVVLCKKYLSSNKWSIILEKEVKNIFGMKNSDDNFGDAISQNGKKIEIKISLGDSNGKLNFVQLRPDHKIDYYLFFVYLLFEKELGETKWLLIPSDKLYELFPKHATYSHGSIKMNGKIEKDNLFGKNFEYSLRPNPIKNCNLWKKLVEYSKTKEEIKKILSE